MRAVLDTNVLLSGLLFGGSPGDCFELVLLAEVEMIMTEQTLDELREKLSAEKFQLKPSEAIRFLNLVRNHAILVEPQRGSGWIPDDPSDDMIVAAALGGGASIIITGDDAILRASPFGDARAITPKEALGLLGRNGQS